MLLRLVDVMASLRETGDPREQATGKPVPETTSLSPSPECPGDSIPESMLDSEDEEFNPRTMGSSSGEE